jgi:hypothetical protein
MDDDGLSAFEGRPSESASGLSFPIEINLD